MGLPASIDGKTWTVGRTQGRCSGCYLGLTLTRYRHRGSSKALRTRTYERVWSPPTLAIYFMLGFGRMRSKSACPPGAVALFLMCYFDNHYRLHQMPCAIFLFSTPQGDRLNHSSHSATPMTLPPRCAECPMPSFHPCTHPMASNPAKPPISSRAGIP